MVTRLIKPLQSYLHEVGIQTSIYVDDGEVVAESKAEAQRDMEFTTKVFQLAGWTIL